MVILIRFKFVCTENAPQKRYFTKCLFSVLQKWYISNMRGIIGGAVYRLIGVITDGLSLRVMGTAFPINRLSDNGGGAVYRPTGVITDGLSLRVMGTAFPSTGYRITAAARSTVQQALLQTVYRCGYGYGVPINRLSE